MSFRVGVAGHRGYSGAELVRLLTRHPSAQPVLLDHREAAPEGPIYANPPQTERVDLNADVVRREHLDLVFLATPLEVSLELAPRMLDAGARVIDLSGAFRLATVEHYARWYKAEHPHAALLAEAIYGLPEFYRERIAGARFIANPGCYPTAANLAIRPLIANGFVDRAAGIICDAKSGVSGAGRGGGDSKFGFADVNEDVAAYGLLKHVHVPEIAATVNQLGHQFGHGGNAKIVFTPHLIPMTRGILETCYLSGNSTTEKCLEAARKFYAERAFVRVTDLPPHSKWATGSNMAFVSYASAGDGTIIALGAIDNLGKGAAGQAVQNANLMCGLGETIGLEGAPLWP